VRKAFFSLVVFFLSVAVSAQDEPSLTIYNGGFAAVRERLPLDLKAGANSVQFPGVTAQLEPESVMLRDPSDKHAIQILEQSYRNDPVDQTRLLSLFEGKTIDFLVGNSSTADGSTKGITMKGKVVRSGYVPPLSRGEYYGYSGANQPVIEVDGQLQFTLPGQPIFPALADDTILKPTLNWVLQTDKPGAFTAELGYITSGMTWSADYNLVAAEKGDVMDLNGWVTMRNDTGKVFENANIRLMAGDVNKIKPVRAARISQGGIGSGASAGVFAPPVTEKAFDEYHLYALERPTTLHDQETKQVEFVHAANVPAKRVYVYDGLLHESWFGQLVGAEPGYGTKSNPKIWIMQEFKNSKQNNLGIALPKGRLRFYRRDSDGSLQFVGENEIDHTPADETVRVYTGNAFDIVGERKRTDYKMNSAQNWFDESFEIVLRNHKKEPVDVRVVEHLYRWANWQVTTESTEHQKKDAQTMEYLVRVPADGEKTITYTVHYSW
jgi:hypothetical protein